MSSPFQVFLRAFTSSLLLVVFISQASAIKGMDLEKLPRAVAIPAESAVSGFQGALSRFWELPLRHKLIWGLTGTTLLGGSITGITIAAQHGGNGNHPIPPPLPFDTPTHSPWIIPTSEVSLTPSVLPEPTETPRLSPSSSATKSIVSATPSPTPMILPAIPHTPPNVESFPITTELQLNEAGLYRWVKSLSDGFSQESGNMRVDRITPRIRTEYVDNAKKRLAWERVYRRSSEGSSTAARLINQQAQMNIWQHGSRV